jgi:hypothetical protein
VGGRFPYGSVKATSVTASNKNEKKNGLVDIICQQIILFTAYRKVAKQQVMLGRQYSESSNPLDKENADHLIDDFVRQRQMVCLKQTLSNDNKNKIKIYINLQKEFISKYHPYKMAISILRICLCKILVTRSFLYETRTSECIHSQCHDK